MAKGLVVGGVVLILVGVLWMLQGLGLVGGSFMTGQRQWLWIGLVTAGIGIGLLAWSNLRPR